MKRIESGHYEGLYQGKWFLVAKIAANWIYQIEGYKMIKGWGAKKSAKDAAIHALNRLSPAT